MGYFVCRYCGGHFHESKVSDLHQWEYGKSIGWTYTCPICGEENYTEVMF